MCVFTPNLTLAWAQSQRLGLSGMCRHACGCGCWPVFSVITCICAETLARWMWRKPSLTPSRSGRPERSASPLWASAWRPASGWRRSSRSSSVSPCPTPSSAGRCSHSKPPSSTICPSASWYGCVLSLEKINMCSCDGGCWDWARSVCVCVCVYRRRSRWLIPPSTPSGTVMAASTACVCAARRAGPSHGSSPRPLSVNSLSRHCFLTRHIEMQTMQTLMGEWSFYILFLCLCQFLSSVASTDHILGCIG